jgi:hypothetical protein
MSDCWTAHFWIRDKNGVIYCQRCGVWYTQPWTAVDAPCSPSRPDNVSIGSALSDEVEHT